MANPFEKLIRSQTLQSAPINKYDDGTIWSAPVQSTAQSSASSYGNPYASLIKPIGDEIEQIDPLEYPRGQINYYTQKLQDAGLEAPKPSIKDKALQIGGTALSKTFDILGVTGAPINAVAGTINEILKTIDDDSKKEGILKDTLDALGAGLKSGGATIFAPLKSKLRESRVDLSDVFDTARESSNKDVSDISTVIETVNPIYGIARLFGAEHDSARKTSGTLTSMVADIALSMKLDIDGIGKALKVVNRGDEMAKIAKITQADDAVAKASKVISRMNMDEIDMIAKKITKSIDGTGTNYDAAVKLLKNGYTDEAASILRRVDKKLGGVGDFKGITMGNKTLLSVEQLQKIGSTKTGKVLANVVGGYASPIGLGWSWMSGRVPKGLADENLLFKLFGGGNAQDAVKSAYKALQDGREEDVISAIYSIKNINRIHNMKNIADSVTLDNATKLNQMLKKSKINTDAIMEAIELHGTSETVEEIIKSPRINPKYVRAAAMNRDRELRTLQKKVTEDGKKLQAMNVDEAKEYLSNLEQFIKGNDIQLELKGDDEATAKFYAELNKVINMPADTPQQRAGITRRIRNMVGQRQEENLKFASMQKGVGDKVPSSTAVTEALQGGTLDKLANNVDDESARLNALNIPLDIPDNAYALPQPKQGQSIDDYYKQFNELKRIDGRKFKSMTEEELSTIMEQLNELEVNVSPTQYEKIVSLSAYEGDTADKLISEINGMKDLIRKKQNYRRLSTTLADRSIDGSDLTTSINKLSEDAGYTKKFFLSTRNKDFNRFNYSYALLDKGLAMRKMIEEQNPSIARYLQGENAGWIDIPVGTRLNKYTDQELTKIYEAYIDVYEGRMPKAKFNWLKKHDEEVIDSWKYLIDEEIDDIKKHYTTFNLPPDTFRNLDNPVLDSENLSTMQVLNPTSKETFEKNSNVVRKWSAEWEAEKKGVIEENFLPSESAKKYAVENEKRQFDLDLEMQKKRDKWLAGTQEDDKMLEYMGINKDEYWEKPYEVLNANKLDIKVFDAETGEYTTTSRERYIEKAKDVYHDVTEARLKGKSPKLSEQQEKMIKHAEMAYEVEATRARLGQTNKAFVAKADEILKKMWGDNNVPVGTEFYDTLRIYKTIDWTNSTLSKILIGDPVMQEIFDKGGQEAVYRKIAEELGIDFKDFFQFKNSKTGVVGFSDKDSFTAFLYERLNPYISKKAKEGNIEYRKLWGIKDYSERFSLNKAKSKPKANLNKKERASALADIFGLDADDLMEGDLLDVYDPEKLRLEGFEDIDEQLDQLATQKYTPAQFRNDKKKLAQVPANVKNSEIAEPTDILNLKQIGKKEKGVPANIVDTKAPKELNPYTNSPLEKIYKYEDIVGDNPTKAPKVEVPDTPEKALDPLLDPRTKTLQDRHMTVEQLQKRHEELMEMNTKKVAEAMKTSSDTYIYESFANRADLQKRLNNLADMQEKALQSGDAEEFSRLTNIIGNTESKLADAQKQLDDLLSVDNTMPIKEIRLEQIKATRKMLDDLEGDYAKGIEDLRKLIEDTSETEDLVRWNLDRGFNGDMSQFTYATRMIQKMEYRDTINLLSEDEKEIADFLSSLYKGIAIQEGLVDQDSMRQYFGYIPHMLNSDFIEDPKMVALADKMGFDIKNPFSVNHMSRKMKGTVLELNRVMKNKYGIDDFFETNALRQYVNRSLKSNNFTAKKQLESMMRNGFEIPVKTGKDFRKLNLADMKKELDRLGIDSSEPEYDRGLGLKYESIPKGHSVQSGGDSAVDSVFVDPKVTRKLRADITDVEKQLKNTTNPVERMKLESELIDLKKELDTKIGTSFTGDDIETGMEITVPFSRRDEIHTADALIGEAYVQRYYDFIKDVKSGKNERFAFARVDDELEVKRIKAIKEGVMSDTVESQPELLNAEMMDLIDRYENGDDFLADMIADELSPMERKPTYHLFADEVEDITIEQMIEKGYTIVDRDMLNQYNKIMDRMTRNRVSSLNKWYNKAMNIFKAWAVASPGFHLNNVIGNTFNTVIQTGMDVFDPKVQKGAYDLLQDLKKVNYDYSKLTGELYGASRADLAREMVENGIMAGFFNTDVKAVLDVAKGTTQQIKEKNLFRRMMEAVDPLNPETNIVLKKNKDLGEFLERQGKISNVLAHMKQGRDMYTAIDLAQEALFDYADLTDFEINYVKQYIAPFYTFAKKNFSYQAENMANNPAVYTAIERIYRYMDKNFTTEKERMLRPDYISGGLKVADGKYISVDTPVHTFANVLDPSNVIGMINPMAKTAVDMLYNKKNYSGQKISRDGNPVDYIKYGLETNLPFMRTADTMLGLFSDDKADKERALRWLAGNRLKLYDEGNAERTAIYQYMDEIQNMWYNSVEDNPQLKDIAAQVAESRKNQNKSVSRKGNPFSRLLGN